MMMSSSFALHFFLAVFVSLFVGIVSHSYNCTLDDIDMASLPLFERPCEEQWPDLAPIYCYGKILEAVNYHDVLFNGDAKHFADRPLKKDAKKVVEEFKTIFKISDWTAFKVSAMNADQVIKLKEFVRNNFGKAEGLLEEHTPEDWVQNPPLFEQIADPRLRTWASELNSLWHKLGRKMPKWMKHSSNHSMIYVPNPFVVPGGRFREFYYWDTYWVVRGLLASGMKKSVKNICKNFALMIGTFGFMPNGGRIYYNKRSQPPFFTSMVYDYYAASGDTEFVREMLPILEKELNFWLEKRSVTITVKGKQFQFCQYRANSNVPRPESFCKDVHFANQKTSTNEKADLWREIASAAESGWDFSSRWIKQDIGDTKSPWKLDNLRTTKIVPVDLNALICGNFEKLAHLFLQIGNKKKAAMYSDKFLRFRADFVTVFETNGTYNDYVMDGDGGGEKPFYGSSLVPFFTGCHGHGVGQQQVESAERMFDQMMMKNNDIFNYPFGIPTSSVRNTGQQWDFPNIWPPVSHMIIEAFRRSGNKKMEDKAMELAQQWLSANYKLYMSCSKFMWMKMVTETGTPGAKGDFHAQLGFGWTNGAVLDLLVKYGDKMTLKEMPNVKCSAITKEAEPEVFPPP